MFWLKKQLQGIDIQAFPPLHEVGDLAHATLSAQELSLHEIPSHNLTLQLMLKNYLKVAWRNMMRSKIFTLINVMGLAVGMAACILILLFVRDELSYDGYHENSDNIYRVSREFFDRDGESSLHLGHCAPPYCPLLKQDFDGIIEKAVRFREGYQPLMTYQDKQFEEERFFWVDKDVFDIFSWEVLAGDPQKALSEPNTLVLTQSTARKYFGEENPIGKTINYNNQADLMVTGLIEDIPHNSHFQIDMLGSFVTLENFIGRDNLMQNWGSNNYSTYLLLKDGYDPQELEAQFPDFLDRHMQFPNATVEPHVWTALHLMPLKDIHLHSQLDSEIEANSDISLVYIFTIIALFVLIIACINFINLSTARSSRRAKEVGLRKVIGANRSSLIRQFISESMLISVIALFLGILLVELSLPFFNDFIERQLDLDYFGDAYSLLLLAAIALISGLVAGSYPAFYLSSFKPISILRKNSHTSSGGKSPLRSVLVVTQFTISIVLIIGVGIVQQQLDFVRNKALGFEKEHLLVLPLSDQMYENYAQIKPRLLQNPGINGISIASRVPSGRLLDSQGGDIEFKDEIVDINFRLADVHVGHDYLQTLGVQLIAGRDFDINLATDSGEAFILNRAAIEGIGFEDPEQALGKRMNYGGRTGRVVGVTENFHFESLHQPIMPVIFMVTQGRAGSMLFRINEKNREEVLAYLEDEWKSLRAGFPFTYYFIEDRFSEQYNEEDRLSKVVNYFSMLAIVIAALGLLGLASFTAERRFKEIGIRKVLGANVGQILLLLTRNFTLLVLLGFVLAIPIAWYAMSGWLESFAYHIEINAAPFLWAGFLAVLLAWMTISWHAYRAATRNPIDALRQE